MARLFCNFESHQIRNSNSLAEESFRHIVRYAGESQRQLLCEGTFDSGGRWRWRLVFDTAAVGAWNRNRLLDCD